MKNNKSKNNLIYSIRLLHNIRMTYFVNSIIFAIKGLPFLKKVVPYKLYTIKPLKIVATILYYIYKCIALLLTSFLYYLILYLIAKSYHKETLDIFLNSFLFTTLLTTILFNTIFSSGVDKYYSIELMRFNAKDYILSSYILELVLKVVSCLFTSFIFSIILNCTFIQMILTLIVFIGLKIIHIAISLLIFKTSNGRKVRLSIILKMLLTVILLLVSFLLPYYDININQSMFLIVTIIVLLLSIPSLIYIMIYNYYTKYAKELINKDALLKKPNNYQVTNIQKTISTKETINTAKTGYSYFNHIFTKRHYSLLVKSTYIISFIFVIIFIGLILIALFVNNSKEFFINVFENKLTVILIIMYMINRGESICQAMFVNCDSSMLNYRFYRRKKDILLLFKERIKTLSKINILPAIIILIGGTILYFISGGSNIYVYISIIVSILSSCVFFSIHYLILYYLLQPFNENLQMKSPLFSLISIVTYLICYLITRFNITSIVFSIVMFIFTVIYTIVSLNLVYRKAYKTFKLRH